MIRLQHCIQMLLAEQGYLLQEIRQQSLTITSLERAQMLSSGPTQAPPPLLEGLRDRLLKGKFSRRVSPVQTPISLSSCPSQSESPALVPTAPSGSLDHLAAMVNAGAVTQPWDSWMPQECERTWVAAAEGPGPPQCQHTAGEDPPGTQTPFSAACSIM